MLNNEMKEIAFKIAKKFKTPLTYQYKGGKTEIYSFTNRAKDKTFSLFTNSTYTQLVVYLMSFNDKGILKPLSSETAVYGEMNTQSFLDNINYFLETSKDWKDFIYKLYNFSIELD